MSYNRNQNNNDGQLKERKITRTQSRNKLLKARENAGDQIVTGFSFAYDWLRECREFSGPITERRKAVPKQSKQIFPDT